MSLQIFFNKILTKNFVDNKLKLQVRYLAKKIDREESDN